MNRTEKRAAATRGARKAIERIAPVLTLDDRLETLRRYEERAMADLRDHVERGAKARGDLAEKLVQRGTGELAARVEWGTGVEEDLRAVQAQQLLDAMERHGLSLPEALRYYIDDCAGRLMSGALNGHSTNPFSNAVDEARRDVARYMLDWARMCLLFYAHARAECETL